MRILRFLPRLLAVLLASLLLLACGGEPPVEPLETTSPPAETMPPFAEKLADYTLIRPDEASKAMLDAVLDLRTEITAVSGTEVAIATDWVKRGTDPDTAGEREILFGPTNRTISAQLAEGLGAMDYIIRTVEDDVVIVGGSDYALAQAGARFCAMLGAGAAAFDETYRYAENKKEGEVMLKIASYNIRHGADVNMNMQIIANDIKGLDIDVVGLQEIDQNCKRSNYIDTMLELSEKTGMPYYAFAKGIDLGAGEYGTGMLSKYPIVSFERTALESGDKEQRAIGHAVLDVEGTLVHFFNTHLSYESKELREKQFAQIAELVPAGEPWFLTGDFNTGDFTEFDVIDHGEMLNCAEHRMLSFAETGLAIDNVVLSHEWKMLNFGMLENDHSDHYMIWCNAQLGGEETK